LELIGPPEPGEIVIADYDPSWAIRFQDERKRISHALGKLASRIEHIGSTAVHGLAAKPIVDILVSVDNVEAETTYRKALESVGYELRVRESGHRMFRTPSRNVHVHIWGAGGSDEQRHLLFRDWLREHRDDRILYEQTKRRLAEQRWADTDEYAQAKNTVIDGILRRAGAKGSMMDRR
jgi:GrpB-like predicted nucleotidyltransferase (UPF0157 family)